MTEENINLINDSKDNKNESNLIKETPRVKTKPISKQKTDSNKDFNWDFNMACYRLL